MVTGTGCDPVITAVAKVCSQARRPHLASPGSHVAVARWPSQDHGVAVVGMWDVRAKCHIETRSLAKDKLKGQEVGGSRRVLPLRCHCDFGP